jgi:hypothetical protein
VEISTARVSVIVKQRRLSQKYLLRVEKKARTSNALERQTQLSACGGIQPHLPEVGFQTGRLAE